MGFILCYIRKHVLYLTDRQVGEKLGGLAHTAVGKYELGKTKTTFEYMEKFCSTFNIEVQRVLDLYLICRCYDVQTSKDTLDVMVSGARLNFLRIINLIIEEVKEASQ